MFTYTENMINRSQNNHIQDYLPYSGVFTVQFWTCPSPIFMQFSGKFQLNRFASHLLGLRPPLGNPGFATALTAKPLHY